ncbi:hypothetical protein R84B8_02057 [Treponema sp. R8-4-B8]
MDLITLANNIANAAMQIDAGRKGFATRGKEQEGRINYEIGIANAMSSFQEASNQRLATTADPQTILLAEYTFISQELQFCEKSDKDSISSLTKAIRFFDDAFLALKTVEDKTQYQNVENCIPHDKDYRVKGFPKDSFHIAFHSHKARLRNILKTPGLDSIEKALLKQRLVNLSAGQEGYVEKQRKALAS